MWYFSLAHKTRWCGWGRRADDNSQQVWVRNGSMDPQIVVNWCACVGGFVKRVPEKLWNYVDNLTVGWFPSVFVIHMKSWWVLVSFPPIFSHQCVQSFLDQVSQNVKAAMENLKAHEDMEIPIDFHLRWHQFPWISHGFPIKSTEFHGQFWSQDFDLSDWHWTSGSPEMGYFPASVTCWADFPREPMHWILWYLIYL